MVHLAVDREVFWAQDPRGAETRGHPLREEKWGRARTTSTSILH